MTPEIEIFIEGLVNVQQLEKEGVYLLKRV